MLRVILTAFGIIACFILQNTVFQTLALASISPNLLIIFTASVGLIRGRKEGMAVGFFCGLLIDIFYGPLYGFYALIYLFIGYLNGFFHKIFYDDDIVLPLALCASSDLLYSFLIYILLFLIRRRFEFSYYLIHIMIPELIYTVVVSLFIYHLINHVNKKLDRDKKRSV